MLLLILEFTPCCREFLPGIDSVSFVGNDEISSDDLKEKVGDFGQELAADVIDPIKEWIKETAMEKLKEIGGNAFKKVMETLATAWTGVKPWWDAAVKVAGGVKLVIDALGSGAARFMSRQGRKAISTTPLRSEALVV